MHGWEGVLAEANQGRVDLLMGTVDVELEPIVKPKFGKISISTKSPQPPMLHSIYGPTQPMHAWTMSLAYWISKWPRSSKNKNLTEDQKDAIREICQKRSGHQNGTIQEAKGCGHYPRNH